MQKQSKTSLIRHVASWPRNEKPRDKVDKALSLPDRVSKIRYASAPEDKMSDGFVGELMENRENTKTFGVLTLFAEQT